MTQLIKLLETYDPDWDKRYNHHFAAQKAANAQIRALYESGGRIPPELMETMRHHEAAWQEAERSSFRTIHDYAAHRFGFLADKAAEAGVPFVMPIFDDNATLEEGMAEYARVAKALDEAENIKENQLPEGRPDGLDIFEFGPNRQIMSARRRFDRELFCAEVVTLISYDLRPTETHICLAFVADDPFGQAVMNNVEQVATVIHREALANAAEARKEGEGRRRCYDRLGKTVNRIRREGLDALRFPEAALAPANMRFYLYVPPECGFYGRDQFMRTPMAYRQGRFVNADFQHFDCVPTYIKNARFLRSDTGPTGGDRAFIG